MSVVDREEHHDQIARYAEVRPVYERYRDALKQILHQAVKLHAPEGLVQVRTKTLSSFAEKAVRKRAEYDDPVSQMTDLCGARVITLTVAEVNQVCRFIRDNFVIDEDNSGDKRLDLGPARFGYASIHFIVQLPDQKTVLGVELPEAVIDLDLRAEIQVRTLLEHVWAAISHDHVYKNRFTVPDRWQRHINRLAAMLEEADGQFSSLLEGLRIYDSSRGAAMDEETIRDEIGTLETILNYEPDHSRRPDIALQIARLHLSTGNWPDAVRDLQPYEGQSRFQVWRDLGYAYGRLWEENPDQAEHAKQSRRLLEKAEENQGGQDAETLACLGWYWQANKDRNKARDYYARALARQPHNPYYFGQSLLFELEQTGAAINLDLLRPSLERAIETCRSHADVGIELPWAFFYMARFHLLCGQPYPALAAAAKGIDVCLSGRPRLPPGVLAGELAALERIQTVADRTLGFEWVRQTLRIAAALSGQDSVARSQVMNQRRADLDPEKPVLIVSGSCRENQALFRARYGGLLTGALIGFDGVVISGGTRAGVCGLVGDAAADLARRGQKNWPCLGYVHRRAKELDPGYDRPVRTEDDDFSPLQPLQMWIDLIASGVLPEKVRLLGIGGGPVSAFEYRLALAMGAEVAVIMGSGGAARELETDDDWKGHKRLFVAPRDEAMVAAFVNPGRWEGDRNVLLEAARKSHEDNIERRLEEFRDDSARPWDELPDVYQNSVIQRVEGASVILQRAGFGVRPISKTPGEPVEYTWEEVVRLGRLEHGRWVMERLRDGWTLGEERSRKKRTSPYLVPWEKLPEDQQEKDYYYALQYCETLRDAGLEIYRP
jgi:ppGpp synthetase/RelA/SpoT-type nucleotidyltranferase